MKPKQQSRDKRTMTYHHHTQEPRTMRVAIVFLIMQSELEDVKGR